jgi:hypothetical protein
MRHDIAKRLREKGAKGSMEYLRRRVESPIAYEFFMDEATQDSVEKAMEMLIECSALYTSKVLAEEVLKRVIDGKPELRC